LDVLPADGSDPVKNFLTIEHELAKYDQELADKPRLLADQNYINILAF
jgi:GTP-binding protein